MYENLINGDNIICISLSQETDPEPYTDEVATIIEPLIG